MEHQHVLRPSRNLVWYVCLRVLPIRSHSSLLQVNCRRAIALHVPTPANDESSQTLCQLMRAAMLVASNLTNRGATFVFVAIECVAEHISRPCIWHCSFLGRKVIVLPSNSTNRFLALSTNEYDILRLLIETNVDLSHNDGNRTNPRSTILQVKEKEKSAGQFFSSS